MNGILMGFEWDMHGLYHGIWTIYFFLGFQWVFWIINGEEWNLNESRGGILRIPKKLSDPWPNTSKAKEGPMACLKFASRTFRTCQMSHMGVSERCNKSTGYSSFPPLKLLFEVHPIFRHTRSRHCLDKSESACNKHSSYLFLTQDESQFQSNPSC